MHIMNKDFENNWKIKTTQEKWNEIIDVYRKAAIEVIGCRDPKESDNTMIVKMSREQTKLGTILKYIQEPNQRDQKSKK